MPARSLALPLPRRSAPLPARPPHPSPRCALPRPAPRRRRRRSRPPKQPRAGGRARSRGSERRAAEGAPEPPPPPRVGRSRAAPGGREGEGAEPREPAWPAWPAARPVPHVGPAPGAYLSRRGTRRPGASGGERKWRPQPGPRRPAGPCRVGSGPAPASSRSPPAPTSAFPGEEASQLSAHGPVPRANPEARRRARRPPPPPAWTWPTPTSLPAALPLFPWQELAGNHATHSSPLSGGSTSGRSGGSRGAGPWLLDPDARPPQALARPERRAFLNNHHSPYKRSFRAGGTT